MPELRHRGPCLALLIFALPLAAAAAPQPGDTDDRLQRLESEVRALRAQVERQESERDAEAGFGWGGYGAINYFRYDWDTDPDRRDAIDLERFVVEGEYEWSERFLLEAEIEFEHGGTGATMELDKFEEFGEYEQEIESGGEVVVEKLEVVYRQSDNLHWHFGHFIVPVGLTNARHEPTDYFTVARPESEVALLPTVWHETGIGVFGRAGRWSGVVQLVNGLDSTGFSSRNWIAPGHQGRFETVNAEAFAYVARLNFEPWRGLHLGTSAYTGNTVPNRPKPDMEGVDGTVTIATAELVLERGPWTLRGQYLHGWLRNADEISDANRQLSNNLNVKRTPVGSEAEAVGVEAGFDVLSLFDGAGRLDVFARYDDYDSMAATSGDVSDNPRWERTTWSGGLNYRPIEDLVFKLQYAHRELGLDEDNVENTLGLGMGFEF